MEFGMVVAFGVIFGCTLLAIMVLIEAEFKRREENMDPLDYVVAVFRVWAKVFGWGAVSSATIRANLRTAHKYSLRQTSTIEVGWDEANDQISMALEFSTTEGQALLTLYRLGLGASSSGWEVRFINHDLIEHHPDQLRKLFELDEALMRGISRCLEMNAPEVWRLLAGIRTTISVLA